MILTVYGSRGILPAPYINMMKYGGNTSCYMIRLENDMVVFDAGTGIRKLAEDLLRYKRLHKIHLFISHAHADHVSGLPYFLPLYAPEFEVHIYGPAANTDDLKKGIFQGVHRSTFPIPLRKWHAHVYFHPLDETTTEIEMENFRCGVFPLNHPVKTLGYRLEMDGKSCVYAMDHEKYREPDGSESAESMHKNRIFLSHIHGADLMIADGQYLPDEIDSYRGWGHSTVADCVNFAVAGKVKKLMIGHHDPNRTDRQLDKIFLHYLNLIRNKNLPLQLVPAMEGMSLRISG